MPILSCTNIRHAFGQRIILDGVSLTIEPGERIGIVGRNGCGKTTLMKILTGQITPDSGSVSLQRGCRAGYLHQDPNLDPAETLRQSAEGAFVELHRLHMELDRVFTAMEEATRAGDDAAIDKLMKRQVQLERAMEAAGGYAIDHKIEAVLHGLGFTDSQFSISVSGLSGGQKGRLALAKLLLEEPDILLLDEPTNHLDIDGRLWLEAFLSEQYRGAVAMISHDRYMLDNVVTRIIEVEHGRLIEYPGNYADFREIRSERRMAQLRAFENQQGRFKKEEAFIRRYKAGQRARQAKGRQSKLDRAKAEFTLERPMEMSVFALELPKAERTGDVVISARGLSKQYQGEDGTPKVLFKELDLSVARGERWGIIGPNGAGKSTLVKCLLSELDADTGAIRIGTNVKVGYYRQLHEGVDRDKPVYRYLQDVILKECPGLLLSEQQARNLAGAFLFSGSEQDREMGMLSGGERSRAVLAGLLASAKNLLVLDEPTNHLDIPSAERLEDALAMPEEDGDLGYEGTLLLISHDRALIDATCDRLLVLDGKGGCEVFLGNYTEWHEKATMRQREAAQAAAEEKSRREESERRRRQAEENKRKAASPTPSVNALAKLKTEQLESKIEKIETRIKAIDVELGDHDVWRNQSKATMLGDERRKLAEELEPLEFEWARRAEMM